MEPDDRLLERAIDLLRRGQPAAALAQLDQAGEGARPAAALAWRAVALLQLGRRGEAMDGARAALRAEAGQPIALEVLRRIHAGPGGARPAPAGGFEFAAGEVIAGRWEVFGSAGGGMGRVYFVHDRDWDMRLAMKSLAPGDDRDAEAARLFRRETQVWLDLGAHPHIVSAYYTLEVQGAVRFFMEYVAGGDLRTGLAGGRLALPRIIDYAAQLAAGMEFAHDRGVVHRDLKPGNVLLSPEHTLRVTDFGLARLLAGEPRSSTFGELEQRPAGTPLYMAPEQWRGLEHAGPPADVYAFATVLHELLTGAPPFGADPGAWARYRGRVPASLERLLASPSPMPMAILRRLHEEATPIPPRELGLRLPPRLEELLESCLAKDPARRPSFARVRRELQRVYTATFAVPYHERGGSLLDSEAGENNRAISYHVMGDAPRARQIADAWLAREPDAHYVRLNRALIDLDLAETDASAVARLLHRLRGAGRGGFARDPRVVRLAEGLRRFHLVHGAPVTAVAADAGGAWIATGGSDGSVRLWRRATGSFERLLAGHGRLISGLAFLPGGALVSAGWDGELLLWDPGASTPVDQLRGQRSHIAGIAAHPREPRLATVSDDGCCRIWDVDGRRLGRELRAGPPLAGACWPAGGAQLVAWSSDGALRWWDADGSRPFGSCDLGRALAGVAGGADDHVVVATRAGELLGMRRGAVLWSLDAGAGIEQLVTGADGSAAVMCDDGLVRWWSAERRPGGARRLAEAAVRAVTLTPDVAELLVGSEAGDVRRLPLAGEPFRAAPLVLPPVPAGLRLERQRRRAELLDRLVAGDASAYAPWRQLRDDDPELDRDGELLAAADRACARIGVRAGLREVRRTWERELGTAVRQVTFAPGGDTVAVGLADGAALVLDTTAGSLVADIPPTGSPIVGIGHLADGRLILVDRAGRLRGGQGGDAALSEGERLPPLRSAAVATTGTVAVDDGDRVRLFSLADRSQIAAIPVGGPTVGLGFSPDGSSLLVATRSGALTLWTADRWQRVAELAAPAPLLAARWSGDGRHLLVRGGGCLARLVDRASGAIRCEIEGQSGRLSAVAAGEDGRLLVTGSCSYTDGAVRLWNASSGALVAELPQPGPPVAAVEVQPGCGQLVTVTVQNRVTMWAIDADWCFAPELIQLGLELLRAGRVAAWPGRGTLGGDLPDLVDMWRDVRAATSHRPAAGVRAALAQLRDQLIERLAAHPGADLAAVAAVDAGLAEAVAARRR